MGLMGKGMGKGHVTCMESKGKERSSTPLLVETRAATVKKDHHHHDAYAHGHGYSHGYGHAHDHGNGRRPSSTQTPNDLLPLLVKHTMAAAAALTIG